MHFRFGQAYTLYSLIKRINKWKSILSTVWDWSYVRNLHQVGPSPWRTILSRLTLARPLLSSRTCNPEGGQRGLVEAGPGGSAVGEVHGANSITIQPSADRARMASSTGVAVTFGASSSPAASQAPLGKKGSPSSTLFPETANKGIVKMHALSPYNYGRWLITYMAVPASLLLHLSPPFVAAL
jgi:hypothetical protein